MLLTLDYQPMTLADLDGVIPIEQAAFGGFWSRRTFEQEIQQPLNRLWCLRYGSEIIGYSGLWRILEEAHLTTLAIAVHWRGKSLGEVLFWLALNRCLREEAHWLTLEVRASNHVALALYKKYDLVQIGQRRQYYPDLEDALVLWLPNLQSSQCCQHTDHLGVKLKEKLTLRGITINNFTP